MTRVERLLKPEQVVGLVAVVAMHAAVLWGLWQHRLIPSPQEAMTLFVNFIAPPAPEIVPPPPPPKPKPIQKPALQRIVAETPVVAPSEYIAPPPPPQPTAVVVAPPAPAAPALPLGPVKLGSELSVACPERSPPRYPPASRRLGEEGTVVLRVELDEHGKVCAAQVSSSSGFARLDAAAVAAVRSWQCHPAQRDGQPVRAVALQPFKFILQES
jgi:protein TonB